MQGTNGQNVVLDSVDEELYKLEGTVRLKDTGPKHGFGDETIESMPVEVRTPASCRVTGSAALSDVGSDSTWLQAYDERVLKLCTSSAIHREGRPLVFPEVERWVPEGEHWFDGECHTGEQLRLCAGIVIVRNLKV